MGNPFCRYDLRTLDPDAARSFYAGVVGLDLNDAMLAVWPLHEQARARGAPPHWLGQIGVADVEASVLRLLELGSERLGPTLRAGDGTPFATLRDPSGAVVAVRGSQLMPRNAPVAWHHLHTRDLERAWSVYSDVFGWTHTETFDVPDPVGGYRMFTWENAGKSVGSMANSARSAGVHPHWLFYFSVTDIEDTMERIRAHGGQAPQSPIVLPNGDRIAPCEDPQGAAFGVRQSTPRS